MKAMSSHRAAFIFAIVLSVAAGVWLRFYQLDRFGLWSDELYSVGVAYLVGNQPGQAPRETRLINLFQVEPEDTFWTWKLADQHPPLYDLILKAAVKVVGVSDAAVRLPSVIFGCLLVFSALLLRKRSLELTAYYTVALALSSPLIFYSQEARDYSLAAMLSGLLVIMVYFDHLERAANGTPIRLSNSALLIATLLLYTHYYGVIFYGSLCLIYAWYHFRDRQYRELLRLAIPVLVLLPYLWMARYGVAMKIGQRETGLADYAANIVTMIGTVADFTVPRLAPVIIVLGLSLAVFSIRRPMFSAPGKDSPPLRVTCFPLLLWLLIFLAAVGIGSASAPFFNPRYLIFAVPLILLIIAIVVAQLRFSPVLKLLLLSLLLVGSLTASLPYKQIAHRVDYRGAAKYISRQYAPGDRVIGSWKPNLIYYLHYLSQFIGPEIRSSLSGYFSEEDIHAMCNEMEPVQPRHKLFFFYYHKHGYQVNAFRRYCSAHYTQIAQKDFRRVSVAVFETEE